MNANNKLNFEHIATLDNFKNGDTVDLREYSFDGHIPYSKLYFSPFGYHVYLFLNEYALPDRCLEKGQGYVDNIPCYYIQLENKNIPSLIFAERNVGGEKAIILIKDNRYEFSTDRILFTMEYNDFIQRFNRVKVSKDVACCEFDIYLKKQPIHAEFLIDKIGKRLEEDLRLWGPININNDTFKKSGLLDMFTNNPNRNNIEEGQLATISPEITPETYKRLPKPFLTSYIEYQLPPQKRVGVYGSLPKSSRKRKMQSPKTIEIHSNEITSGLTAKEAHEFRKKSLTRASKLGIINISPKNKPMHMNMGTSPINMQPMPMQPIKPMTHYGMNAPQPITKPDNLEHRIVKRYLDEPPYSPDDSFTELSLPTFMGDSLTIPDYTRRNKNFKTNQTNKK